MMLPETATPLEVTRASVAVAGAIAAIVVAFFTVKDFRLLRREGVNGPTGIVYAERFVVNMIFLTTQLAYIVVGISAMLAPPPIPQSVAALVSESSEDAALSVAVYLVIAVQASIYVTTAMLAGSLWQLASRPRLSSSLRHKSEHARTMAEAQAQSDRIEATGRQSLERLRREGIGDEKS